MREIKQLQSKTIMSCSREVFLLVDIAFESNYLKAWFDYLKVAVHSRISYDSCSREYYQILYPFESNFRMFNLR